MKFTFAWKELCSCLPPNLPNTTINVDVYKGLAFRKTINTADYHMLIDENNQPTNVAENIESYSFNTSFNDDIAIFTIDGICTNTQEGANIRVSPITISDDSLVGMCKHGRTFNGVFPDETVNIIFNVVDTTSSDSYDCNPGDLILKKYINEDIYPIAYLNKNTLEINGVIEGYNDILTVTGNNVMESGDGEYTWSGNLTPDKNSQPGEHVISDTIYITIGNLSNKQVTVQANVYNLELRRIESETSEIKITGQVKKPIENIELKEYFNLIKDENDTLCFDEDNEKGRIEIITEDFITGINVSDSVLNGVNSTEDITTQISGSAESECTDIKGKLILRLPWFNTSKTIPVSFTFTPKTNEILGYYVGIGGTNSVSPRIDGIYIKDENDTNNKKNWINPSNNGRIVWHDESSEEQIEFMQYGDNITIPLKKKYTLENPDQTNLYTGVNGIFAYSNSLSGPWNEVDKNGMPESVFNGGAMSVTPYYTEYEITSTDPALSRYL